MAPAPIDLRSDTVTRPTSAMRRAMAEAEVGDDVFREDPTVRALEERAAARVGKEAALFVASGTLGNQLALALWTRPGQQVIVESASHIVLYEAGGASLVAGVALNGIPTEEGWFGRRELEERTGFGQLYGSTGTGLVAVENSHNRRGGLPFPRERLEEVRAFCREKSLPLHMDGARLFNAALAAGEAPEAMAARVDSVMFCLSKGLGCPVGSMLSGSQAFIDEARSLRQILGGGMRQAGVLAAAGLVALETMVDRLQDDHRRARTLADGLAALPGIQLDPSRVRTNLVYFDLRGGSAPDLCRRLEGEGVLAFAVAPATIRMVLHHQVADADVTAAVRAVERCLGTA